MMGKQEAVAAIKEAGFKVIELLEESDGVFFFLCERSDGAEIEVVYESGDVIVAPT